ncbi:MAG TPA: hypothetical protein VIS73_05515, partial [Rhodocyclaceae bacterium]
MGFGELVGLSSVRQKGLDCRRHLFGLIVLQIVSAVGKRLLALIREAAEATRELFGLPAEAVDNETLCREQIQNGCADPAPA